MRAVRGMTNNVPPSGPGVKQQADVHRFAVKIPAWRAGPMKKNIVFALRCTAVTLLVAWLAGMAIPYKVTCSATWVGKTVVVESIHGKICMRYLMTYGRNELRLRPVRSWGPRVTSVRGNETLRPDGYMDGVYLVMGLASVPDFGGWSWRHAGFWIVGCPGVWCIMIPTYASALFLFGLCGMALLPIYGKVMRGSRRQEYLRGKCFY